MYIKLFGFAVDNENDRMKVTVSKVFIQMTCNKSQGQVWLPAPDTFIFNPIVIHLLGSDSQA